MKTNWQERFDEKFPAIQCDDPYCGTWIGPDFPSNKPEYQLDDIKPFIETLLEEVISEIPAAVMVERKNGQGITLREYLRAKWLTKD